MVDDERNDFVAGVMVALALVPGAAIGGMAPALGDVDLAVRGGLRWAWTPPAFSSPAA
ncbi:MAG: hypothetical protein U0S49_00395 [Rhodospirillales bacterium]|nr:hypothetical protein [Rhodospirillales bacterium]